MKGLLFTYALTYGGAAVSLFNPFIGLLIYVCFAIIKPESMWYFSVPEGNYSRIVAVALLVGWTMKGFGRWQLGRASPVVACFLGYWLWALLSTTQANEKEFAWRFVEELTKILLPFLVGITTIDSVRKLKQLAWVILLSQGYVAYELNLNYLGGFNRVVEVGFASMDNNSVAIAMDSCIGLAFFLGLYAERWWHKALAFGSALLMVHVVLFSFSRGGMIGLLITGAVGFFLIPKEPKHYLALAVGILLTIRLAGPEVQERFLSSFAAGDSRDFSSESRLSLWADCLDCMLHQPLFGVGPNNWPFVAVRYGWPLGKEAHTLWLQVGAELGFPGLLLLLGFYGICSGRLIGALRTTVAVPDPWFRHLARMVVASLVGFAVSGQFVSLAGLEIPYYITLIGAGVLRLASAPVMLAEPYNVRDIAPHTFARAASTV